MQGGFRRTAAPDPEQRPLHSSTPPSHRHSVHLTTTPVPVTVTEASPPQTASSALPLDPPLSAPIASSSNGSNSFAKRFGSILGRSEDRKHLRQRNSISVSAPYTTPVKEKTSPLARVASGEESEDLDISLAVPQAGQGVGRASTTGAELSPPRHTRGVSVDTASPNAAALSTST